MTPAPATRDPLAQRASAFLIRVYPMRSHAAKIGMILLNILLKHDFLLALAGALNRRFCFLATVFLVYPATPALARRYAYRQIIAKARWRPWIIGAFRLGGKWGLTFAISNTEDEFIDFAQRPRLAGLVSEMSHIQALLCTPRKTFAGILPGVLVANRLLRNPIEMKTAAAAVVRAEQLVRTAERLDDRTPIILLGALGYVGRYVARSFGQREVYSIDRKKLGTPWDDWPAHLRGIKIIVINVTRREALRQYLPFFWPGMVILNEVYPEPNAAELKMLALRGCRAYHVVGLHGRAFPPFPQGYSGAIPCCAGFAPGTQEVIIRRLV